jgi:SAM-dependent methyltransferase
MTADWKKYWNPETDESCIRGIQHVPFLNDSLLWIQAGKRLLDIGCGVGDLVFAFRKEGRVAEGITYLPDEIEFAKKQLGIDLKLGDMHDLPFEDNSFDTVVLWDSLEHAQSAYIALCEARRVTEQHGRGLIFIPGHVWQLAPYHILLPTQAQMAQLLWLSGWTLYRTIDLSNTSNPIQKDMAVYWIVNEGHVRQIKTHDYSKPRDYALETKAAGNLVGKTA